MPSRPPTAKPIQVSRYGITDDGPIPADLPFAAALRRLMADRDQYSMTIGIDPTTSATGLAASIVKSRSTGVGMVRVR